MYGFDTINYSLRPNKVIQRQMVFDGLQILSGPLDFSNAKYVGFGSIWFADFVLAHKRLGIEDMLSIEKDEVTFRRAKFNSPFRTIKVVHGHSGPVLSRLTKNRAAKAKPWLLWLDYVSAPTADIRDDIDRVVDHAPAGSVLLLTMNVVGRSVGAGLIGRREQLRSIFGDAFAADAPPTDFEEAKLPSVISHGVTTYIASRCRRLAQRAYVPAFSIPYRDNAQMLTLGGILPSKDAEAAVRAVVTRPAWPCLPSVAVETPPLTPKELTALQRALPARGVVTTQDLERLGFRLEDGMLETYCAHYRRYPSFFQVVA